jgi:hypothetical protein
MNPEIAIAGQNTQFSKENQPANPGRKRNLFNYLKEDYELSQNDLDNIVNHICTLPLEEVDRLLDLIKTNKNAEEVRKMPLLYYKILEGMMKAKTNDILQFMKMSGKAAERHEIKADFSVNSNDPAIDDILKRHGIKSED